MATLDELRPGDRVFAKPAQSRGTIQRIMPRPALRQRPIVVELNGAGVERRFAPSELIKLGAGDKPEAPGAPDEEQNQ